MIKFKVYDKASGMEITDGREDRFYLDRQGKSFYRVDGYGIMPAENSFKVQMSMPEIPGLPEIAGPEIPGLPEIAGELIESTGIDPETELAMRLLVVGVEKRPDLSFIKIVQESIDMARIFFKIKSGMDAENDKKE